MNDKEENSGNLTPAEAVLNYVKLLEGIEWPLSLMIIVSMKLIFRLKLIRLG